MSLEITMSSTDPENLSRYRLNDMGELFDLYEKYGHEEANNTKEKIFRALLQLERGHSYNLANLPDEKKELAVKLCCLWILHNPDYEFSNDYTKIRHL